MQNRDAAELRKEWGDKPCPHPRLEKEHYLGIATGDFVCAQCGTSFTR